MAATVMRNCGLWLFTDKRVIGALPGIEIGDMFSYRVEMCVLGLHVGLYGHRQAPIDFMPACRTSNWNPIATSIVVYGGYEDNSDEGNVITYLGHGGQDKHFRQIAHQKMEGGNLALAWSMHYNIEVRVIRGCNHDASPSGKIYVYEGLYRVVNCWPETDMSGYTLYKYRLERLPNQPQLGSKNIWLAQSHRNISLGMAADCACLDMSMGKEKIQVQLFNNIDNDHERWEHEYLVQSIFPSYVLQSGNNHGCQCLSGCSNNCLCVKKNGGQFAYNKDGILIQGKPLIFECGPSCPCPPNCRNRVSQRGLRHRLEVFRSRTGWGVRPLDYIQAGSFICEYAGVVLTNENAKILSMGEDNLVHPRRFSKSWKEWGDLSEVSSNYISPTEPKIPRPLDYAVDVSSLRNVASYISHSTSPNVMVQFILYDYNNIMFPRLMLFAMETIPPFRELSLDYGGVSAKSLRHALCN